MKITKFIKKAALAIGLPVAAIAFAAGVVSAQSTGITGPQFNIHNNVDGVGSESDFLRIRKTDGTKVNTIEACEGEVTFWFYVHNGQSTLNNGENYDGVGVAKNTRIKLQPLPTTYGKNHTFTGTVMADNAASVTDTANITCGSEDVKVEYEAIQQFYRYDPNATEGYELKGDITSDAGAQIGFPGGIYPGCWEYRTIVLVKVKIVKKPVVPEVSMKCVIADPKRLTRTKYEVTATAEIENTEVTNYTFTTKNSEGKVVDTKSVDTNALSQNYVVEQTTPGKYTVKAEITTKDGKADGNCETEFTVEEEPKTPIYSCDMFTLAFVDRKATVSFVPNAKNGATFENALISFNADGKVQKEITTDNVNSEGKVVETYTYTAGSKNTEVIAKVRFNVPEKGIQEVTCKESKVLGVTTPPTTTPKTGAGDVFGILTLVAAAGAFLHRKFTLGRN